MIKRSLNRFLNESSKKKDTCGKMKLNSSLRKLNQTQGQKRQRPQSRLTQKSLNESKKARHNKKDSSHKKHSSTFSFDKQTQTLLNKQCFLPCSFQKSQKNNQRGKVYSSAQQHKLQPKKEIQRNNKITKVYNQSFNCLNQSTKNTIFIQAHLNQTNCSKQNQDPMRKRGSIKTEYQNKKYGQLAQKTILTQKNKNNRTFSYQQQQLQKTSKQISQLQSRCQTIDLLRFTLKTKLSKEPFSQSNYCNSLMTSDNKNTQIQYIEQLKQLKQLETNFYVQKITSLQSELNKLRKQRQIFEEQNKSRCNDKNIKINIQNKRVQEQKQLLRRENQALRTILMKRIDKKR